MLSLRVVSDRRSSRSCPYNGVSFDTTGCPSTRRGALRHGGEPFDMMGHPSTRQGVPRQVGASFNRVGASFDTLAGRPLVVVRCQTSALGCPRRCGQPCGGVCVPWSLPSVERRRWAAYVVVGSPAAALGSPRRRSVSNVGLGLPTSLRAALLRRLCPLVVAECRMSALGRLR